MPRAPNCCVVPRYIVKFCGEMLRETRALLATVSIWFPLTPESEAVIVASPAAIAVTEPVAETVAIAIAEEVQVADEVTSLVEPSL